MARFSKVLQMLAVVLVIAVVNVYVMAVPVRSTDPKKADAPETTEKTVEVAKAEVTKPLTTMPAVAAEKLPLVPNSKIDFNRIFSKNEIRSRAAANHTFFNVKVSGREAFKAPPRTGAAPQSDPGDDDDDGARSTWIAVGIIAAVLTLSVIMLRKDRSDRQGSAF